MYSSDGNQEERLKRIEEKLDQLSKQNPYAARMFGYEYKSKQTIFGMPLVHIAQGMDPETGRPRVAKGFIAIGNVAIGVFAVGGIAFGVFALAGVGVGLCVFAGMAVGVLLGIGGMATGVIAFGGMAIGWYAFGGAAFGVHTMGGASQDPELVKWLHNFMEKYY